MWKATTMTITATALAWSCGRVASSVQSKSIGCHSHTYKANEFKLNSISHQSEIFCRLLFFSIHRCIHISPVDCNIMCPDVHTETCYQICICHHSKYRLIRWVFIQVIVRRCSPVTFHFCVCACVWLSVCVRFCSCLCALFHASIHLHWLQNVYLPLLFWINFSMSFEWTTCTRTCHPVQLILKW